MKYAAPSCHIFAQYIIHVEKHDSKYVLQENSFMKVLDIFSWVSEKQLSLVQIEQVFRDYVLGIHNEKYSVQLETPDTVSGNILECKKSLTEEGKQVAYMLADDTVIAVIGYKE